MTYLVHKKRKLSVNLLRFLRHVVPMHWPGHGCDGGEPGQSLSAESVISVWIHLGGHCLRRLSWGVSRVSPCSRLLPSPPGSSSQKACTQCELASLCSTYGSSCAGGDNRGNDRVGSQKKRRTQRGLASLSSACGPHALAGARLGWRRARTELVHQKRELNVNSPCRPLPVAMCLGRFPCVVPCARILPSPQGLTSR